MAAFKARKESGVENYIIGLDSDDNIKSKLVVLFNTLTGSRLYGTQYEINENPLNPNYISDYDYRGVFLSPIENLLGLRENKEDVAQIINGDDEEYYDLIKFIRMAADNNPNIMDILFAPDEAIKYIHPAFKEIRDARCSFLHLGVKDKFVGYADSQLSRLKSHRKFLTQYPEIHKLERKISKAFSDEKVDFEWIKYNFSGALAKRITGYGDHESKPVIKNKLSLRGFQKEYRLGFDVSKYARPKIKDFLSDGYFVDNIMGGSYQFGGGYLNIYSEGGGVFLRSGELSKNNKPQGDFLESLRFDEGGYKKALKEYGDLWKWHMGRNQKRAILEDRYGYDTKHAMHLYRLLLSAKQIITTGDYNPRLSGEDLKRVKEVREGKVKYEDLIETSNLLKNELNELVKTGNHKLRKSVDENFVNDLILKIYKRMGVVFDINPELESKNEVGINKVITVTGGTASGKTTLVEDMVKEGLLERAITFTTRPMREGEVDGVDYYFVSLDKMREMELSGELVEPPNEHGGNLYAVAKQSLISKNNLPVAVIVDPNGANHIRKGIFNDNRFNLSSVFIEAVPKGEMIKRMHNRGSSDLEINNRINELKRESSWFDLMDKVDLVLTHDFSLNQKESLERWKKMIKDNIRVENIKENAMTSKYKL